MITLLAEPQFKSLSEMGEYVLMNKEEREEKYPPVTCFDVDVITK